jgi:EAL domain-containing protein (putative c-di-GMP-specific phosphodiesterase class I)
VTQIGTNSRDQQIVHAIVALAKSLQLSVTAEGIESTEQLRQLRALGCNRGQGYLLARPQPPDAIPSLLATRHEAITLSDLLAPIA